jgi:hypothetical protein
MGKTARPWTFLQSFQRKAPGNLFSSPSFRRLRSPRRHAPERRYGAFGARSFRRSRGLPTWAHFDTTPSEKIPPTTYRVKWTPNHVPNPSENHHKLARAADPPSAKLLS